MHTNSTTEIIERIHERMQNRQREIRDLHNLIVEEREHEHGMTLDQAQGILDMLLSFDRDDEDLIEKLSR